MRAAAASVRWTASERGGEEEGEEEEEAGEEGGGNEGGADSDRLATREAVENGLHGPRRATCGPGREERRGRLELEGAAMKEGEERGSA
jgi:hypothetical protein